MSEVCTPRYFGRSPVYPWVVEKLALVANAMNGGEAYPVRAWLRTWNPAMHTYSHCRQAPLIAYQQYGGVED